LIFLSAEGQPDRIVHVMLWAGADEVIEAPRTGLDVRRAKVEDVLGVAPNELMDGATIGARTVWLRGLL
jgi:hypothetical protein